MKLNKIVKTLEWIASISALGAKILLALSLVYGWPVAAFSYFVVGVYNILKKGLKVLVVLVSGMLLLSLYGWYKWESKLEGVFTLDYIIILITFLFCILIGILEYRSKTPFWRHQILASVFSLIAFLLLGLRIEYGWHSLFVAHILLMYIYYKRGARLVAVVQIISAIIALTKMFGKKSLGTTD